MNAPENVERRARRAFRRGAVRAGALALSLAACGDGGSAPELVRLSQCAGRLHALTHPPATEILREDLDRPPEGWRVITSTRDVRAADASALRQARGSEDGRSFLTLSGRGALYHVVPVEPGTPYRFSGDVRARDLRPEKEPFFGASFWVAEVSHESSSPELFAGERKFDLRHPLPSAFGTSGWQRHEIAFRTRPETRSLVVGCLLAVNESLTSGEVDFDDMGLERLSEREYQEREAARAVAAAHRGTALPPADDWRARRLIDAMLSAEHRPALLCLPGERLELDLEVPEDEPVLECGLAPWPAFHREGAGPLVFRARVDGREILSESLAAVPLVDTGWRDVALELAPFSGRRVRLELAVEGELPGVFGAPVVRARGAAPPGWNVIFVSIDTLRADRVGAYGAASGATPRLDALAAEGLVFENMLANAPYTLPAHATLFSGQFPSVHGAEDRDRLLAPRRSPVLAEALAARGYRTQAFTAGGFLSPDFGLDAGFDGFSIADPLRHTGSFYFDLLRREYPEQSSPALTAEPGTARVRRWIEAHAGEAFFLFLHTYEVHDYDPPPGTTSCAARGCVSKLTDYRPFLFPRAREPFVGTPEDRAHLSHLYDAALAHVDGQLGLLLDDLARLGLAERTLVVVTSDHGEELFERGYLQHGKTLHEEMLRVPLIVRVPGEPARRIAEPAMQVDVAPTILGVLDLEPDARMQGRDLLRTRAPSLPLWSEVDDHFARKQSLREGEWKLVHGPLDAQVAVPNRKEWELYDLARDPGETRDLAASEPERLERMRGQLRAFQEHLRATRDSLGPIETGAELDEATRGLLEHLGYGGGEN